MRLSSRPPSSPPPPPGHPLLISPPTLPRPRASACCRAAPHESLFRCSSVLTRRCPPPGGGFSWNQGKTKTERRSGSTHVRVRARASRRESPYDVLGVSPSANPQEIKRAYRKLALRYHPDVNKEANAKEKFMRIKHAYNTLMNAESKSKHDRSYDSSDYSRSSSRKRNDTAVEEEEFYGFGNFLRDVQIAIGEFYRDLQAEFQNWEASINSQEKPKSLWEELANIGEEFVEFLEKELNIDPNSEIEGVSDGSLNENSAKSWDAMKDNIKSEGNKQSTIEDSIDEIEAALAQLKKELGL